MIALQGLGRYDAGLVADLSLVKLFASLRGRWPEQPAETAELLDAVRRVAGTCERLPARGLRARARPGRERRPRAARAQRVQTRRVSEIAPDGSPVLLYARLPALGEAELIHAAVPEGSRILELGAGAGRITHELIALGHEVVAVDNSSAMLAFIRGAETVLADMETLDLETALPRRRAREQLHQQPGLPEPPPVSRMLRATRSSERAGAPAGISTRLGSEHRVEPARRRSLPTTALRAGRPADLRRDGVRGRRRRASPRLPVEVAERRGARCGSRRGRAPA